MSLNLFIVGPSGGGVTQQATLIATKYGLANISMGQLLRDQISMGTELGVRAKLFIDQGRWVPDEITFSVLKAALRKINNQNFILDGYPRAINQGPLVEEYLSDFNQSVDALIHLNIDFAEIANRRALNEAQGKKFHLETRTDDTPQSIARQYQSYRQNIAPILNYFRQKSKLFDVDANRSIENIFSDICQYIDQLISSKPPSADLSSAMEKL